MSKEIRVRNAPSPTGFLHIGSVRTFLYNYLFARKNNGKYILRIEDTDRERLVPGSLENIVESLANLHISADEGPYWDNGVKIKGDKGPYVQSERLDLYKKYSDELLAKGEAYYCFCTKDRLDALRKEQEEKKLAPRYDKHCLALTKEEVEAKLKNNESHVVRLNVKPGEMIEFEDMVYGPIKISTSELDDQVLMKSDGFPTYHLAVVVDDYLMEISHVIRANEWIPSTPKHVLLYRAFGWELPVFVHLPPVLSKTTGKKLSKREGDVAVKDFLAKGYLPEAIINFLAFLGWNPKTEQEMFSMDQLIAEFSLEKLNKAGAVFDYAKLDWFNSQYIRQLPIEDLYTKILPFLNQANLKLENFPKEFILKVLGLEKERLKVLSEVGERVAYFFTEPQYDADLLVWKKTNNKDATKKNLQTIQTFIEKLDQSQLNQETLETEIKKFITDQGLATGEVLWPLRVALSGLEASPGPFEIMDAFGALPNGKEIILTRITQAINKL